MGHSRCGRNDGPSFKPRHGSGAAQNYPGKPDGMRAHYRQRASSSVLIALDSIAAEKRAGVIGPLVSFGFRHHSFNIRSRQSKSSLPVKVADAHVKHLSGAQRERNEMMKHY